MLPGNITDVISFSLNDEHEALRQTVRQFAVDAVAPVIGGYYERGEFPYEIMAEMGKLGLFGLPFPEEYGGMGGDYFALCLAWRSWPGWIPRWRSRWKPGCRSAQCRSTASAPRSSGDGGCPSCAGGAAGRVRPDRARRRLRHPWRHAHHRPARAANGEVGGSWVVNGTKAFITNSGTSITSLVTVLAITGRRRSGRP